MAILTSHLSAQQDTTICATATATGGALGVIRLSGKQALAIADGLFRSPRGAAVLAEAAGRTLHYGHLIDPTTGEVVDEVMASVYRAPHSYTGEDSIEFACHGSPYVLERTLSLLIEAGAVLAQPGEFTQRAFFNGKMDLSQAEAVADLIAARSAAQHRMAVSQLRGAFSSQLRTMKDQLLRLTALIELELDFSDHEDLEFADRSELRTLLGEIMAMQGQLIDSFRVGNALKHGVPVAIVGHTNAGKSTLLNALVGDERAIVSDIHGTTRDVIEDTATLGGITYRFIDTAGLRTTTDTIEQMGIARSWQKMEEANIILWVVDAFLHPTPPMEQYEAINEVHPDKPLLIVLNKADLIDTTTQATIQTAYASLSPHLVLLSAAEQQGLVALQQTLTTLSALPSQVAAGEVVVSNVRHVEALRLSQAALERTLAGLDYGLSGELLAMDLREAIRQIGEIVGEITADDALQYVFRNFCIGK